MRAKKRVGILCLAVTVAASSLCTYTEPLLVKAADNQGISDGFEENSESAWESKDGAVLSVVTDESHNGTHCLKVSGRESTVAGAAVTINGARAGQMLKLSAYAKYVSGPDTKTIQATLAADGEYYVFAGGSLAKDQWGEIKGSLVLPENIDLSNVKIFFETPWTPSPNAEDDWMDYYIDDVNITLNDFSDISGYPALKELYQDEFYIGVAAPDQVLNTSVYSNLVKQQFNSLTMENEMKPGYILDQTTSQSDLDKYKEQAALNFDSYRNGMEYAKNNGIHMRGHTLVWHSQTPDWFFYEDYDTSGALADRELMLKRMENYIKDVIAWTETNYPGVIYAWDVVNEAVADPWGLGLEAGEPSPMRQEGSLWYQTIGEDFVQKAFAYARKYTREYAPDHEIKLFYNDYNEYFSQKRDGIIELLKPVKEAGNIDGVGMQSHIDTARPLYGDDGYMTALEKLSQELDVEIHVTELDIGMLDSDTEESQGAYYEAFMDALLAEKQKGADITCVTFWGLTDTLSWRSGEDCLLFREDLSGKPAFYGVVSAANKAAAAKVTGLIDGIGTVTESADSQQRIIAARTAYDKLTEEQKKLVTNAAVLTEAEAAYEELTKPEEPDTPVAPADPEKPGTPEEPDDPEAPSEKLSISTAAVGRLPVQIYTGKEIRPAVTVTCGGKKLVNGKDYSVSYKNNVKIGKASATITGKGSYTGSVTKKFTITVKKNKVYQAGNYKYKITKADISGKGTVTVVGSTKKTLKSVKIKDTVKIGGKKFKVTAIGSAAFKGSKNLGSVTIGKNVTSIGSKAFYQCKKLKKITIKNKTLGKVGKNALKGISGKAVITCPKKQVRKYKKLFKKSTGFKKTMKIKG